MRSHYISHWPPYHSLEDANRLAETREALLQGDIGAALKVRENLWDASRERQEKKADRCGNQQPLLPLLPVLNYLPA